MKKHHLIPTSCIALIGLVNNVVAQDQLIGTPGPEPNTIASPNRRMRQPYSIPGEVGARVSKLFLMLEAGHHGVTLTDEEWRRLIVSWGNDMMESTGTAKASMEDVAWRAGVSRVTVSRVLKRFVATFGNRFKPA